MNQRIAGALAGDIAIGRLDMIGSEGRDTDGSGTSGAVEEKTREAQAGETDTTRLGMADEAAGTDGEGTGGMAQKDDASGSTAGERAGN